MCFCQKGHLSHFWDVKVKTWGSPLRRKCGTGTALHTFRREAITFSHFSFISPNPFFWHLMKHNPSVCLSAVRSSQTVKWAWRWRLFDVVVLGCVSVCLWCRVQIAYLNLWAPPKLEKAFNLPTPQRSCLNPLFCFLNQVLQTPSTAPSIHPSIFPLKTQDFNDFSGVQLLGIYSYTTVKHALNILYIGTNSVFSNNTSIVFAILSKGFFSLVVTSATV